MAAQITLVRRDDFVADVDSMSLWNYANGFSIDVDGWAPARPVPSDNRIVETITLRTKGTSPDNLAANLQSLDGYLQKVSWFNNPQELYGIWLRVQQPRETGARQALITSVKRDPIPLWSHTAQDGAGGLATYNYGNVVQAYGLALERTPYWESDASITFDGMTAMSSVGGMATLSGSGGTVVAGDVPARLASVELDGVNGGGGPMAQFWVGFRSSRFGAPANFVPAWSLHKANTRQSSSGVGGGTATVTADPTCKDGTAVVCGFNDSVLAQRLQIKVSDVSASNYVDQRGTFLVLLRAKLLAAGQVNVLLADGLYAMPVLATRDRVAITSTSYAFYEMGTVQIPSPGRTINGASQIRGYALALQAERVLLTPTLSVDCFVMIPLDEGWIAAGIDTQAPSLGVSYFGGDVQPLTATERADGTRDASWVAGGIPQIIGVTRGSGGLPVGNADIVVMAAQRQTGVGTYLSTLADTATVVVKVYERWETMRGAAT